MAAFITLTNARLDSGVAYEKPIRVSAENIVGYAEGVEDAYYPSEGKRVARIVGTYIDTVTAQAAYLVTETPEQIDAMLGVTESSQSAADIAAEPIKAMIREKRKLASSVVSAQVMSVLAVEAAVLEEAVKVIYAAFGAARGE